MKIEDRVRFAIEYGSVGEFERAVDAICPAVEASARRLYNVDKISSADYKRFIRGYYFIIEPFSGTGLNMVETTFTGLPVKTDGDRLISNADVADVIYHCYRCAVAHGHAISDDFSFTDARIDGVTEWSLDLSGQRINLPTRIVWALVAAVVFCKANSDVKTASGQYLTYTGCGTWPEFRMDVDLFWGGEELIRRFFEKFPPIRVAMRHSADARK